MFACARLKFINPFLQHLYQNRMNWNNSYAICPYKEGKKPIPKKQKEAKYILENKIYFRKIKK
ncbi:hypothetical protein HpHCM73_14590 [Helicobacter pylori]